MHKLILTIFMLGTCFWCLQATGSVAGNLAPGANPATDGVISRLNSEIKKQEQTLRILKDLLPRYQDGLITPDEVEAYIVRTKMGPDYAQIPLRKISVPIDGKDLDFVIPDGYDLSLSKELAPGYNQCMDKAQSRYDMGLCDDAAVAYYDRLLNDTYSEARSQCTSKQCSADLLTAQRAWVSYREATNRFLKEYISLYGYTASIQTNFWRDELIKQYELLKIVAEVLSEFKSRQ